MPEMPDTTPPGLRWMRAGGVVLALGLLATIVAFLPNLGALEARPVLWVAATGLSALGLGLIVAGVGRAASARRHRPDRT